MFLANPWRDQNDEHQGHRAVGSGHEIVSRRSVFARQVHPEVVQPEESGRHHEPVWTQHAQIAVGRRGIDLFTLLILWDVDTLANQHVQLESLCFFKYFIEV